MTPESIAGKAALVTGASSGIGEGVALVLARAGATVAVTARRADRLHDLVRRIESSGGKGLALPGDITDEAFATEVVERAAQHFGRLDILVNSAGAIQSGGVANGDTGEWRRLIDVNLLATLYTCKAAVAPMKAQGAGDIVNITSHASRRAGNATLGAYSTSKVAVATMTEGLRQEVGGFGIRVCNIEPGAVTTEIAEGISDPPVREGIQQYLVQEGAMTGEEIGDFVLFVITLPSRINVSEILLRPTKDTLPM
jgi:NADP-dependent 3-hydroxy acid dehydrogenase YdfG